MPQSSDWPVVQPLRWLPPSAHKSESSVVRTEDLISFNFHSIPWCMATSIEEFNLKLKFTNGNWWVYIWYCWRMILLIHMGDYFMNVPLINKSTLKISAAGFHLSVAELTNERKKKGSTREGTRNDKWEKWMDTVRLRIIELFDKNSQCGFGYEIIWFVWHFEIILLARWERMNAQ